MAFCRVEYGSLWGFRSFLLLPLPFLSSPPHTPPSIRADVLLDYVKHFPFPGTDLFPHRKKSSSSHCIQVLWGLWLAGQKWWGDPLLCSSVVVSSGRKEHKTLRPRRLLAGGLAASFLAGHPCWSCGDSGPAPCHGKSPSKREPCSWPTLALCLVLLFSTVHLSHLLLFLPFERNHVCEVKKKKNTQRAPMK